MRQNPLLQFEGVSVLFLLLCCFKSVTSSSQPQLATTKLDFSYLHRVKSSSLAEAIRDELEEKENDDVATVEIDISASMIGKDIQEVLSSIEEQGSSTTLRLVARQNQWSPSEAATILKALIAEKKSSVSKKAPVVTTTETDENVDSSGTKAEDIKQVDPLYEVAETAAYRSTTGFPSIQSLDLGWNELSQDHRGSKMFLKALQKVVEDSNTCPEIIRLDVCGLGPAACRALGKVRVFCMKSG